ALWDVNSARMGESYNKVAQANERFLSDQRWQGSDSIYVDLLQAAQRAAEARPGDVVYRFNLNVYRWNSLNRLRDPASGKWPEGAEPSVLKFAHQIVAELQLCRPICPTYGPVYCQIGQLELFVLNDP